MVRPAINQSGASSIKSAKGQMRITKAERIVNLYRALERIGITGQDVDQLLRIERTLSRWSERECGDGNSYGSWAIERDEATDKPYEVRHYYGHGQSADRVTRTPIADREAGAKRKLAGIMAKYPSLVAYIQGDPRGCALYILTKEQVGASDIDSIYTRGVAVCI
jgi:hypothetical protein